jgi:molybdopterin molybdotransferase
MLPLERAQEIVLSLLRPLPRQTIALSTAAGRVLASSVLSPLDLPRFDNSAMDGYAIRAEDVQSASPRNPIRLRVIGRLAAGAGPSESLSKGTCIRLFTGSPLPPGADAVVMQEDTRQDSSDPGICLVTAEARPWENVRFQGEDLKKGELLVEAGELLTASHVALLAATGHAEIDVAQQPAIGLVATGNELGEPGSPLGASQIFESNRLALAALATQAGAVPKVFPLVKDTLPETMRALADAFRECDAVVTSGGVSVGEHDLVKAALVELGGELNFWRVAIKPGKPFALGQFQGKLLFGLPGNPVSAFVTFLLLVRPALLRFQGARELQLPISMGILAEPLLNNGDRRHFLRVYQDRAGQVRPSGKQASHLLFSLAHANGLVDLPPNSSLPTGAPVGVFRWG